MVTLSLLKFLENNGIGTIDQDLFWEKMGLGKVGLYITDLGSSRDRGGRQMTNYQIFSRGKTDVDGYQKLEEVAKLLNSSYSVCMLPEVPPVTEYYYSNVTIMPVSTISNDGLDGNGRVIFSITGVIYFGEKIIPYKPGPPREITTEEGKILITEDNKVIIT